MTEKVSLDGAGEGHTAVVITKLRASLLEGAELRIKLADTQLSAIAEAGRRVIQCLEAGGKLLLCGNGGSAADCQHIAAELTGRFLSNSRPALAALALTTDTSALTAISNDMGYEQVFARQVEALGRSGDVLVAISTSGGSVNVLAAAATARSRGLTVIVLTGPEPGALGEEGDIVVATPGASTARIQELHLTVGHLLCGLIDEHFAS